MEKKALGRGLEALIPTREVPENLSSDHIANLPISQIRASKYQPRLDFNTEKLNELISSIKEKGVVQPVLVRKSEDGYELIAGERRLRAAKSLGFESIPAIIKSVSDLDMLEISLIENIQREELNPIEEAHAFQRFISEFSFTQDRIAQALGKDRSTIANTLRLLALPKKIQEYISNNSITAGHAKALLSLPTESSQLKMCHTVIKKSLSVRETENLVSRRISSGKKADPRQKDPTISDIEATLQQVLGTRVRIFRGKKRGHIQVEYYSSDDLNRIIDIILPKKT